MTTEEKEIQIAKIICRWVFMAVILTLGTCVANTHMTESSKVGVARAQADQNHEQAIMAMWEHIPVPPR